MTACKPMQRIPILEVQPLVEGGQYPIKSTVGEEFVVSARIFAEGRGQLGAAVVLTDPSGRPLDAVAMRHIDNDYWAATVHADEVGSWTYHLESWHDPYATWLRDAPIKIEAGVDTELMLHEGADLLERADIGAANQMALMRDGSAPVPARLAAGMSCAEAMTADPVREHVGRSSTYRLHVDRRRAVCGAWYEMFPRSEGAVPGSPPVSGTFVTAAKRLPAIADMGFDVIYLPPIHPIGTINRKGRNNALTCEPHDPGSPWAIGSTAGGHDAINPELGTIEDFASFVAQAAALGIEVALDFALQCAPDHPWVLDHPEWFTTRLDGTIAFAENPPKKYQDIYPLDFDNDLDGLCTELIRILRYWMSHGVRIFRVDNPHTKPLIAWEKILTDVRRTDPDVIFLAEAFTTPAMLHALAMVGFQQSYTYFTWRIGKDETGAYLAELANATSHFLRPNFFVNTPDILPSYLQTGTPAIFKSRAVLAATGSPSWGVYAGFELFEHEVLLPGTEDYRDSEKYELKFRNWDDPGSLAPFIAELNALRNRHLALQQLRGLHVHTTDHPDVLCFSRCAGEDRLLVVVDLDPGIAKLVAVTLDLPAIGLDWGIAYLLRDELSPRETPPAAIRVDADNPARVFSVQTS